MKVCATTKSARNRATNAQVSFAPVKFQTAHNFEHMIERTLLV